MRATLAFNGLREHVSEKVIVKVKKCKRELKVGDQI